MTNEKWKMHFFLPLPSAPAYCRLVKVIRMPCFGLSVITGLSATG
jgi:hypothetical protein